MSERIAAALLNAKGFLDNPIKRRRYADDDFYNEVVASIRQALPTPSTDGEVA